MGRKQRPTPVGTDFNARNRSPVPANSRRNGMDASHFEVEVRGGSLRRKWTLRADGIKVPKVEGVQSSQATGGPDMNRIVFGVDIAKRVCQLHCVEPETGEIGTLQLKR